MAQNGSKKAQKIFLLIFYHIIYFFKFLVIFSDFLDHFLIFGPKMAQNGSKWAQKGPKNIFVNFLSNYLFLRIFGDFFKFFGPFSTTFQKSGRFGPEFDPFGPLTRERDFSRICGFRREFRNIVFFHFKQKKVHINGLDFSQNSKNPILGPF